MTIQFSASLQGAACLKFEKAKLDFEHRTMYAGDCIVWTGGVVFGGYGVAWIGEKQRMRAHRLAYILYNGEIPEGYEVDHLCRNRMCVNPAHLEAVTPHENKVREGRDRTRVTKCRNGHNYDEKNTGIIKGKYKYCRKCSLLRTWKARGKI